MDLVKIPKMLSFFYFFHLKNIFVEHTVYHIFFSSYRKFHFKSVVRVHVCMSICVWICVFVFLHVCRLIYVCACVCTWSVCVCVYAYDH